MMKIYINNKEYQLADGASIDEMRQQVEGLPDTGIAIALNNEVVPRQLWGQTHLAQGDRITIIKAFYGG